MKQNSEILCLSRAGDLRFLPTEILACKGFSGISLSLLSPSCLKDVLASCTPATVMPLLAAACFVHVCVPAQESSSFSMSSHGARRRDQALWTMHFFVDGSFRRTTFPAPKDLVML
jgi:hypothetical protein